MKQYKKIIFINIVLFTCLFFILDFIIYKYNAAVFYKTHPAVYKINNFKYMPYIPEYLSDLESYFNGRNNFYFGRKPDGLEYKNKTPIILFGCSYAFGQHLNYNQTLSYKLAHLLHRPVYNRAMSGGGFQHMYMQSTSDSLYKTIPDADTVIYVMISDHYRRSMLYYFDMLDVHLLPHYSIKNNKLIQDNYNNYFYNFFKSLYIVKHINHIYAENYINNPKNAEKITDNAVLYFIETRKNLEERYNKKLKFIIIFFEDWEILYRELLEKKLRNNGFITVSTKDLTGVDLRTEEYSMQDNHHPTEKTWDMLTPEIIKILNL